MIFHTIKWSYDNKTSNFRTQHHWQNFSMAITFNTMQHTFDIALLPLFKAWKCTYMPRQCNAVVGKDLRKVLTLRLSQTMSNPHSLRYRPTTLTNRPKCLTTLQPLLEVEWAIWSHYIIHHMTIGLLLILLSRCFYAAGFRPSHLRGSVRVICGPLSRKITNRHRIAWPLYYRTWPIYGPAT